MTDPIMQKVSREMLLDAAAKIERLTAALKDIADRLTEPQGICNAADGPDWLRDTREIATTALGHQQREERK